MTGNLADAILARVKAALERHRGGGAVPTLGTVEAALGNGHLLTQAGAASRTR